MTAALSLVSDVGVDADPALGLSPYWAWDNGWHTVHDLDLRVEMEMRLLRAHGVGEADLIAVAGHIGATTIIEVLACLALGALVYPVNSAGLNLLDSARRAAASKLICVGRVQGLRGAGGAGPDEVLVLGVTKRIPKAIPSAAERVIVERWPISPELLAPRGPYRAQRRPLSPSTFAEDVIAPLHCGLYLEFPNGQPDPSARTH